MSLPPLAPCRANPRYLADPAGQPVLLVGSHHWDVLVDNAERPAPLPLEPFLATLARHGHSCLRLWTLEAWSHRIAPRVWERSGPGRARDGGPRYDLDRFAAAYFTRLRERVEAAAAAGLYAVVMCFQGWSLDDRGEGDPWPDHPLHRDNNVNGVDGDPGGRGDGSDLHRLRSPAVLARQEAYVERVVAAVGDLPSVLYEVANESPPGSLPWQRHMLAHLRACQRRLHGTDRPCGLSAEYGGVDGDEALLASGADWVSPGALRWRHAPPSAAQGAVVLADSDHLWGVGGDAAWVWRTVLAGHQALYMDPWDGDRRHAPVRRALGAARHAALRLDLGAARPRPDLAASGCCLADLSPGREALLAWAPRRRHDLDLRGLPGPFRVWWVDPGSGERAAGDDLAGGRRLRLRSPLPGAALHLERQPAPASAAARRQSA